MKGQSSLEFISIITLALVLSSPLIGLSQTTGLNFLNDISALQFDNSLTDLADTVERSNTLGPGFVQTKSINVPNDVVSANKVTNDSFVYYSRRGENTYRSILSSSFRVLSLPIDSRQYDMNVINIDGESWILEERHRDHLIHIEEEGQLSFNALDVPSQRNEFDSLPNQLGENSIGLDDPQFIFSRSDNRKGFLFESQPNEAISTSEEMAFYAVFTQLENQEYSETELLALDQVFSVDINTNGMLEVDVADGEETEVNINQGTLILEIIIEDDIELYQDSEKIWDSSVNSFSGNRELSLPESSDNLMLTEFIFTRNSTSEQTSEYLAQKYGD